MPSHEQIPVFGQGGEFAGQISRDNLYTGDYPHRIAHNLIYHPVGIDMEPERMWAQVRSDGAKFLPGHLVTATSGHVNMGADGQPETFLQAIQRETAEEAFNGPMPEGFAIEPFGRPFDYSPSYPGYKGGKKTIAMFMSESDGANFTPDPVEVNAIRLFTLGELKDMARDPESKLHPEFREILQRKMVRIGVVGTYSAGKTTLTEALGKRIMGSAAVKEDVRHYVKNIFGKKGIQELTPEEFIRLEHMLFKDQTVGARKAEVAIVDSTPIGCPVYLKNYGLLAQNGHQFDEGLLSAWKKKVRGALSEFDVIVYLPPEIPYENDGFRTGEEFRGPLDRGFREMIENHPRVLTVTGYEPGNVQAGVDKRVKTVLDYCMDQGLLDPSQVQ